MTTMNNQGVPSNLWGTMMNTSQRIAVPMGGLDEKINGQDGSPGFAEAIDRNLGLRPFAFTTVREVELGDMANIPIGNLLKDLFKRIAPKLLRFPSATRNPLEMKGQKGWSELVDPVSALIPETVAPLGPISPDTRQRKLVPSRRGIKGISSHLNLIVDCSISMADSSKYATLTDTKTNEVVNAGGRMSARFVAALLVEQARSLGDSFSIFTFGGPVGNVQSLTRGASRDYKGVVEYLLAKDSEFRNANGDVDANAAPFAVSNSTPLADGIAACCATMVQNRSKIRGALTICILDGHPNGSAGIARDHIQNPGNTFGWTYSIARHLFDGTGPATKMITEWDYDNYGKPKTILSSNQWNPRADPRMWLNEERLRREFGPVLYVIVGSGNNEASVQQLSAQFNAALRAYYLGDNVGIMSRERTRIINGQQVTEHETDIASPGDGRLAAAGRAGWSAWDWDLTPPNGDERSLNGWRAASIRGPCSACSNSFTISSGAADIAAFGGDLLRMARAGKGGDLQRLCFTAAKRR